MAEQGATDGEHTLVAQVDRLVGDTIARRQDGPLADGLERVRRRLREPLRVAIAGRVKAGKSTLLNALVGEQLAPTDAGECTRIVTWYQHGPTYRVTLDLTDGTSRPARFTRQSGSLDIDLDDLAAASIDRIVVEWPSKRLADLTLIDTPGVASLDTAVSERARAFLAPDDDRPVEADAVLYLMRHMHADDLSFLESFHDDELTNASPINALGLLSRADEIGVGRPNAMRVAERIAGRYRNDPRLRRLCQTVLPINGLVAETAATLTQEEFAALAQLAELDRGAVEKLLLSADRFRTEDATIGDRPCPVPALVRTHLLDRLGLFGVRVALPLIRQGRTTSALELAEALEGRSGIVDLRRELLDRFARRSDVLRARSALLAVSRLIGGASSELRAELAPEIERIRSGAHAFAEIRLLNDHRRGAVAFPGPNGDEVGAEIERLLGGDGTSPAARLGLPVDAGAADVRAGLLAAIDRWRRRGEHPLASPEVAAAAAVLVRTCEGALAGAGRVEAPTEGELAER
ncbi:MAG: dynamin family protein [Actinomycetota bacterium]